MQIDPTRKTRRTHGGLTLDGMAAHILSVLFVSKTFGYGIQNDCQEAMQNLIRSYHSRLRARDKPASKSSVLAESNRLLGAAPVDDHSVPVACFIDELLDNFVPKIPECITRLIPVVPKLLEANYNCVSIAKKTEHDWL